jgi:hypothetical protein
MKKWTNLKMVFRSFFIPDRIKAAEKPSYATVPLKAGGWLAFLP